MQGVKEILNEQHDSGAVQKTVISAPGILVLPSVQAAHENKTVIFTCSKRGYNSAGVVWRRLEKAMARERVFVDFGVLKIKRVALSDLHVQHLPLRYESSNNYKL